MNKLGFLVLIAVALFALLPKTAFSYTATPVQRCPGDAGKGFDDIDFLRNYLDPNSKNDLWDKCWKAYEARQICSQICDDGYYASLYEADMAYVDYLRTYLDTPENLDRMLNSSNPNYMSDAEFNMFIRDIKPPVYDISCFGAAVAEGSSAQCEQIRTPGFTCNGGSGGSGPQTTYSLFNISVPESFYSKYVGTVVFNYNIECEDGNSPDVLFIRNTYLPRYQKAVSDIDTELDGIKKTREENSAGGGGSQEPNNEGSNSIDFPQGDVIVPATSTELSTLANDLGRTLSANEVRTVKQNTQSYIADLPDTPAGKEVNVNLPGTSDVSRVAAKTNAPISNVGIDMDVIDIHKSPELLRKPDLFYDSYNPNNPLIPPPDVPTVEILAMKMYKKEGTGAYSFPVTTPTGTEGEEGFSAQNYMQDFYFQFRLPPDIMQAASAGQEVHTGSKDLYIKTESDLQHVQLRHYNYVTGAWDVVPTKSVGKCDLQMCVFVAGPTSGRSYYAIVVENETTQSSSATTSPIPNLPCCLPSMIIFILISLAVTREEAGDSW